MANSVNKSETIKLKRFKYSFSLKLVLLLLYIPIGLVLAVFRLFLFIILLPVFFIPLSTKIRNLLIKYLSPIFGLWIDCQLPEKCIKKFIISNHVSHIDSLILSFLISDKIIFKNLKTSTVENMLLYLFSLFKFHAQNSVQLCFAENTISHSIGILKFALNNHEINENYGMIGLNITRLLFNISISTEFSNCLTDTLFLLFCPLTVVQIFFIEDNLSESINRLKGEENLHYARKRISEVVGLPLIEMDFIEKDRLITQIEKDGDSLKSNENIKLFESINNVGDEMYRQRKKMLYEAAQKSHFKVQ